MPRLLASALLAIALAGPSQSQTVKRVANLALGSSQILVDATDGGTVVITGVQNHLDAVSVLTLSDVQAWLDTALVVTAAHDPRQRERKWVYSVSGPALFLYRAVGVMDEEFIVGIGKAVRVSLVLSPKNARELLEDLAAAARLSRDLTSLVSAGRTGNACALGIAVALPRGIRLSPPDSSALWMDKVREQLEIRLATVTGVSADAGRGVWFTAEADGNATGVTPDTVSSSAVTALRDAITFAGGWHAFRGVPGGAPVRVRASLAPRCPR